MRETEKDNSVCVREREIGRETERERETEGLNVIFIFWERERERDRQRQREREKDLIGRQNLYIHIYLISKNGSICSLWKDDINLAGGAGQQPGGRPDPDQPRRPGNQPNQEHFVDFHKNSCEFSIYPYVIKRFLFNL